MNIVIIGSGNVATQLGRLMKKASHTIIQVLGRNPQTGEWLAGQLHAAFTTDYRLLYKNADLYCLAVQDDQLPLVAAKLKGLLPADRPVVHTSGSVSLHLLDGLSSQTGVLYPLQSLHKNARHIPRIPLFVDASNAAWREKLLAFARTLSPQVAVANDAQRQVLHIAAVFASNFSNYLYTLAEGLCKNNDLPFEALLPLMEESVNRLEGQSSSDLQTGPAVRGDRQTIERHLTRLQGNAEAAEVYRFLTEKIQAHYHPGKTED